VDPVDRAERGEEPEDEPQGRRSDRESEEDPERQVASRMLHS